MTNTYNTMKHTTEKHDGGRKSVVDKEANRGSAGLAQAEPRGGRKRGKKNRAKRSPVQTSNCGYLTLLSLMPPLIHKRKSADFFVSHSDVYRFILLSMNLNPYRQTSWSEAAKVFHQVSRSLLHFDHDTGKWHGCDYQKPKKKKAKLPPRIQKIMAMIYKEQQQRKQRAKTRQAAGGSGQNQPRHL